jgi:hypothetical protein
MASLTQQMEQLQEQFQEQQRILAEKIKEEEERKHKLSQEASIERLEALIEPITQCLDRASYLPIEHRHGTPVSRNSYREDLIIGYEMQKLKREQNIKQMREGDRRGRGKNPDYDERLVVKATILANEEIFVTLLGIVKKQDARIRELENVITSQ